jgi:hypothetical protein
MKFTNNNQFQGDTQWFELQELPKGLKKIEKQFIAASEKSGSFHALFGNYDMYEAEGGFVIDAKEECILNHSLESLLKGTGVSLSDAKVLPKKDHRHSIISKGIHFVGIQQRFDPLSGLKEKVRD